MTRARFACIALSFALFAAAGCASGAKSDGEGKPQYAMTMKTAKRLQKVREYVDQKNYEAALEELDDIAGGAYLNPYERAKLFEARAGLHFATNEGAEVVKDLEQALSLESLPKQERLDATYNLAQAYFMLERFSESADAFARWAEESESPEPKQYYLIASAFSQAKRFDEALPYMKKAIDATSNPPEPWFQLLASLHYELEQNAELAAVLQRLADAYPKKEHLLQLSATHAALGQDDKALAALETLHAKGLLTEEKEVVSLARLQLKQRAPKKAAAVLDEHMKKGTVAKTPHNLVLLAQCFVAAGDTERATKALDAAGDSVADGEIWYGLAQVEAANGQWEKARDAVASAIRKGGLRAPGDAHLLLGVAHYHTKRKDAAIASLTAAKRHGAQTAQCADAWIKAIKSGKQAAKVECATSAAGAKAARK